MVSRLFVYGDSKFDVKNTVWRLQNITGGFKKVPVKNTFSPYTLYGRSMYGRYALYGRFLDEKSVDPYTDAPYLEAVLRILWVNDFYKRRFFAYIEG